MQSKSQKYIGLIADMYNIPATVVDKISANTELIERELENYLWEDIKWAIQKYYTHKNDKTYPKLCHVLAILEASGKRCEKEEPIPDIKMPHTEIKFIQDVFMTVCKKLYTDGIFYNEYFDKVLQLPFGNKTYIDKQTGHIMNKNWIWDDSFDTLERNYPQERNKFKRMTLVEKYALAWKMGCYNVQD